MYGVIYKITNKENNKSYIGQTTYSNPEKRWNIHKAHARKNSKYGCIKLQNAIRKYGEDKFEFSVIGNADDRDSLDIIEIQLIKEYDAITAGYNIREGGYGSKHSEETKRKYSETRRGKPTWNKGIPHTDEAKKKMSDSRKGKPSHRKGKKIDSALCRPIIVEGKEYKSVAYASQQLGVPRYTLHRWLKGRSSPKMRCKYK